MTGSWFDWPVFLAYLYLGIRAYGYLRDHHGTDDNNWLEGVGAFALAPFVALVMPFLMLAMWRRERSSSRQHIQPGG